MTLRPDVLVVGGGPAGLTAATALRRAGAGQVLVLDRESEAGGIPRHSDHLGYGLRDLRRLLTGPQYARRLVRTAVAAGADVRTQAMVTSWEPDGTALVTTPAGRLEVAPRSVVLATGARERPRAARLVPGDRPHGVYTTGQLQNLVHLHHGAPGRRAVVVGAELVSWSAVLTLREAGCRTVLMTSTHPVAESYAALSLAGRLLARTELATSTRVVNVIGHGRVEAVEIEQTDTGARRTVPCDTVVFTGDWIPDHELARTLGLDIDAGTLGPAVDAASAHEPTRSLRGRATSSIPSTPPTLLRWTAGTSRNRSWTGWTRRTEPKVRRQDSAIPLRVERPLRWVSPNVWRPGDPAPARGRLLLWTDELVKRPTVSSTQQRHAGRASPVAMAGRTRPGLPGPVVDPGRRRPGRRGNQSSPFPISSAYVYSLVEA